MLQVPPGLDCATVSRWLHEGITEEQMRQMERLHAINDARLQRERETSPRRSAGVETEAHQIELPRMPTQAEIEEDEALFKVVAEASAAKTSGGTPAAPAQPEDATDPSLEA